MNRIFAVSLFLLAGCDQISPDPQCTVDSRFLPWADPVIWNDTPTVSTLLGSADQSETIEVLHEQWEPCSPEVFTLEWEGNSAGRANVAFFGEEYTPGVWVELDGEHLVSVPSVPLGRFVGGSGNALPFPPQLVQIRPEATLADWGRVLPALYQVLERSRTLEGWSFTSVNGWVEKAACGSAAATIGGAVTLNVSQSCEGNACRSAATGVGGAVGSLVYLGCLKDL